MEDKNWLLRPSAVRAAKKCMQLVQSELGVRLPLSHPEFLQLLNDYAELADNEALRRAVGELNDIARAEGATVPAPRRPATKVTGTTVLLSTGTLEGETVSFNGRAYPRWSDGKEFRGLYRGQPRYE